MSLKLMGKKRGMARLFDDKGNAIVCTVIEAQPNVITQVKTQETDGYRAIQLGAQAVAASKIRRVRKPNKGHFAKAKVEPHRHLAESKVGEGEEYSVGQTIGLDYFADTPFVDVTGVSKGKGFQGLMKRRNFAGGPAAHGSGFHRHAGSTGMRSTPGRCLPGTPMPSRMGGERVTTEMLRVLKIDLEKGLILVKGAVPGARGGLVYVRKAAKRPATKK